MTGSVNSQRRYSTTEAPAVPISVLRTTRRFFPSSGRDYRQYCLT